ncbi:MAG: ABC-2 family transporter protein [Chloroflexi bacterium]|nr:ABC-2 family transporter protein [Chloroflexota bacterium]
MTLADRYPPLVRTHALGLTLHLLAAHAASRMEYRANFLLGVVNGLGFQLAGLVFVWAVLHRFPSLGGWSFGEVAFLYALRLLGHSLYLPFLQNVVGLGELVQSGGLDRLLLRPVHPLLLVVSQAFQVQAVANLLVAGAVFYGAQAALDVAWSVPRLVFFVLALAGAVLIETGVHLFLSTLSVWLVSSKSRLNDWADGLFSSFGSYPFTVLNRPLQLAFTFLLPLAFVAYFPAAHLLDRRDEGVIGIQPLFAYATPAVGVVTLAASLAFFEFALRHYRSTGH